MADTKITLIVDDGKTRRTREFLKVVNVALGEEATRRYCGYDFTNTIRIDSSSDSASVPYIDVVENLPRTCKHCGLQVEAVTDGEGANSPISYWIHTATTMQWCSSPLAEPED